MSAPIPPRVPAEPPDPPLRCTACGRGHYVAVRFCPFCGTAQARADEPGARAEEAGGPGDGVFLLEGPVPTPAPPATPARPPARPSAAPPPVPAAAPRRFGAERTRPGWLVAGLLAAGLAAAAFLGRGPRLPEPARIGVGAGWTAVALAPLRGAPRLRLTGDAPFGLRLDGERVQRVGAGGSAVVRPGGLRGLELRALRGRATVLLTPAE